MLDYFVSDSTGHIIFNRPDCHNAISLSMWQQIPEVVNVLCNSDAKVIVLSGSGGSFASGADLSELQEITSYDQAKEYWLSIKNALLSVKACSLPVIAKIEGACIGGGCLIASAADLRYASENASFGIPIAKLGILIDEETIRLVSSLIGIANAKELIFTAEIISAKTAYSIGLINTVITKDKFDQYVDQRIAAVKKNVLNSLVYTKILINNMKENDANYNEIEEDSVIKSYLSTELQKRILAADES